MGDNQPYNDNKPGHCIKDEESGYNPHVRKFYNGITNISNGTTNINKRSIHTFNNGMTNTNKRPILNSNYGISTIDKTPSNKRNIHEYAQAAIEAAANINTLSEPLAPLYTASTTTGYELTREVNKIMHINVMLSLHEIKNCLYDIKLHLVTNISGRHHPSTIEFLS